MGSKTRLSSYCTKRANNGVNLVTSRNINTRLARPIAEGLTLHGVVTTSASLRQSQRVASLKPCNVRPALGMCLSDNIVDRDVNISYRKNILISSPMDGTTGASFTCKLWQYVMPMSVA